MNKALIAYFILLVAFVTSAKETQENVPTPSGIQRTTSGSSKAPNKQKTLESDYQEIVDDYKAYLSTVPQNVQNEIREFRTAVAKIQKRKKELYKKLSNEAQEYLKTEEGYRRKLPIKSYKDAIMNQKIPIQAEQSNTSAR